MSAQFTICSYNLGIYENQRDFSNLCTHLKKKSSPALYQTANTHCSSILPPLADVFLLQEVMQKDRSLIAELKRRKFHLIHLPMDHLGKNAALDTLVALNPAHFKDVKDCSINMNNGLQKGRFNKDLAVAEATHIPSGKKMVFVSMHAPGFDFAKDPIPEEDKKRCDLYFEQVMKKVAQAASGTLVFMGGDLNTNPEKTPERFENFKSKQFRVHRSDHATNVNPDAPSDPMRELDFFFDNSSPPDIQTQIADLDPLGWDETKNPSDHLPIFMRVSIQESPQINSAPPSIKRSMLARICQWIANLFKLFCCCSNKKQGLQNP